MTFQQATPAVEAHLKLPNQKHTRDAAAQVGFFIPFESSIRPAPIKQDAEFARSIRDHVVIIVGKECACNIEKFLNLANVSSM